MRPTMRDNGDMRRTGFQLSPGAEAGCACWPTSSDVVLTTGFNSHPALRPDAPLRRGSAYASVAVFQLSPGSEAGCAATLDERPACARVFQLSPGSEAGCAGRRHWDR